MARLMNWIRNHFYETIVTSFFIVFIVVVMVLSGSKAHSDNHDDLLDAEYELMYAVFDEYPEVELTYVYGALDELTCDYDGTPLEEKLRCIEKSYDEILKWVESVRKSASTVNHLLPDDYRY